MSASPWEHAAESFETWHGDLRWQVEGVRCFVRQDGDDGVLTLLGAGGPALQYVVVGVVLADL